MKENPNPLQRPAGDLERVIEQRITDDLWKSLLGELPCLDSSGPCIRQLQGLAVSRSGVLREIDRRIEEITDRIEQARANNQRSVIVETFSPAVQALVQLQTVTNSDGSTTTQGFLTRIASLFVNPTGLISQVLSVIGVPLFTQQFGGSAAVQSRTIQIADLQARVAQLQRDRAELADRVREAVTTQVIEWESVRREFQISQEIIQREKDRMELREIEYRFGGVRRIVICGSYRQWIGYGVTLTGIGPGCRPN